MCIEVQVNQTLAKACEMVFEGFMGTLLRGRYVLDDFGLYGVERNAVGRWLVVAPSGLPPPSRLARQRSSSLPYRLPRAMR